VRFDFEQVVKASPAVVARALVDPAFYPTVKATSAVAVREVVDAEEGDGAKPSVLRIRLAFVGQVSGAVRRFVDPSQLTWVTVLTQRPGAASTTFEIVPDHYKGLLESSGDYRYAEQGDGTATRLTVGGDVSVKVPIVGRKAEQPIANGFRDFVADQARALEAWGR
jgi:hypothetical protein